MPIAKKRVLIVDDEPATRLLLGQIFSGMGHDVAVAEDGFTALEAIRQAEPDLILSDLNMPGMSGFELLSVVRRRLPSIYVIASSGAYTGDSVPEGISADAFYEKATTLKALFEIVKGALGTEARKTRRIGSEVPVWLTMEEGHSADKEYFVISCTECLRTFSHVHEKVFGVVHHADCVHCKSPTPYAVVRLLAKVNEQAYQMELDTAGRSLRA
ncbi:Response regulator receiver domain-containing protein [Granulicella pectinivorans]|jgi:CheY-like chemotaxis protein|uniref:Response regulator receiver domain-containing protein n=1 Tax=Granulicella pectinivorans TaxID=474950 RepID=A0A1I6M2K0_9BACT|nr:response regulator [Granulicella pectinivorans]SFS09732.1 Response regulator receiver domain-containing protein [Granulicella pectinivorans]